LAYPNLKPRAISRQDFKRHFSAFENRRVTTIYQLQKRLLRQLRRKPLLTNVGLTTSRTRSSATPGASLWPPPAS